MNSPADLHHILLFFDDTNRKLALLAQACVLAAVRHTIREVVDPSRGCQEEVRRNVDEEGHSDGLVVLGAARDSSHGLSRDVGSVAALRLRDSQVVRKMAVDKAPVDNIRPAGHRSQEEYTVDVVGQVVIG